MLAGGALYLAPLLEKVEEEEEEREGEEEEEEGRSPGTGAALGRTYVWNASDRFVRSGAARRSLNRKQWLQLLCK